MSRKAHGQIRRAQVITTYGPGALIDLPRHSAVVGGLDTWSKAVVGEEILEPRLVAKVEKLTGVRLPRFYAPPVDLADPQQPIRGIGAWRFPEWFVVQDEASEGRVRSRRLVHRKKLDQKGLFEGRAVVATRFVRACPKGHVDDIDWYRYVHRDPADQCRRQLWLDERGTSGDLADLVVRCACGQIRGLYEASMIETIPLGMCSGARPWLGKHAREECNQPNRLLIRTASNAYFAQVVSVLSLPDRGNDAEEAVRELWDLLVAVDSLTTLAAFRRVDRVREKLAPFSDVEVLAAIETIRGGRVDQRPVKEVELEAILAAPEGYGEDVPVDPNFHARRLPDRAWRRTDPFRGVRSVVQLHRLREILALIGFTRLEPVTPDINGEYEGDVVSAQIAKEPEWFPAVENRGEGVFLQLDPGAVDEWRHRPAVVERLERLKIGHDRWAKERKSTRPFPGGPYVLLHTLSHLLIESLAMRCGYPASSIRERIYAFGPERFGILLYTGSPDADGTLGGLVQQGRYTEDHLLLATRSGGLCSNDPVCAQHEPGTSMEERWLHGAACHGCALIAETSCEMHNDYLDRALVVPVLGVPDAAFF